MTLVGPRLLRYSRSKKLFFWETQDFIFKVVGIRGQSSYQNTGNSTYCPVSHITEKIPEWSIQALGLSISVGFLNNIFKVPFTISSVKLERKTSIFKFGEKLLTKYITINLEKEILKIIRLVFSPKTILKLWWKNNTSINGKEIEIACIWCRTVFSVH